MANVDRIKTTDLLPAFVQGGVMTETIWTYHNRPPSLRSNVRDVAINLGFFGVVTQIQPVWIAGLVGFAGSFFIPQRERRLSSDQIRMQRQREYENYLRNYVGDKVSSGYLDHFQDQIQQTLGFNVQEFQTFSHFFKAKMLDMNANYIEDVCKAAHIKGFFSYFKFLSQTIPERNRHIAELSEISAIYATRDGFLAGRRSWNAIEFSDAANTLAEAFFPSVGEHITQNFFDLQFAYPSGFTFRRRGIRQGQERERARINRENDVWLQEVFANQTQATQEALEQIKTDKQRGNKAS